MTAAAPGTPLPVRPGWGRLGVAFGSGIVVGLCFPPFGFGPLVLVALVPLLWAWRGARPRHAALYGFAFGTACYGVELSWIRYFGVVATVPLVAALAAGIALVGGLTAAYARRGLATPLLTAAAWTLVEALLGRWPLGGFPWCDIGVALHDVPAARALASIGGVLLVSFVVVAVNGFVLELAIAARDRRARAVVLAACGLAALALFAAVADATWFEPTVTGHLRFALLQGDDQELSLAGQNAQQLTGRHLELADGLQGHYDLIVFPESSLDTDPQQDPQLHARLAAIAAKHDASLIVNARTPGTDGKVRNSNLLIAPDGQIRAVYSKEHLVPFGEYVPWRDELGFIGELRQIPYDYQAGHRRVLFDVAGHPVGSVICFESAFGPLVRDVVRDGVQAVVVSTSNRSYRRSGNSRQHLALSQMRAAETARPVLQASVSGISAVISPHGTVSHPTKLFEATTVTGTIATTTGETLYVRFGDWIVALSALALVVTAGVAAARDRRERRGSGGVAPTSPAA